jgi:hypothetical protein
MMTLSRAPVGARRNRGRRAIAVTLAVLALAACTSGSSGQPTGSGGARASSAPAGSATASQPAGGNSGSAAASSPAGGVEGATGSPAEKCPVTSSAAVAAAFTAKVTGETVSTSGIGSPLCQFKLTKDKSGAFGGLSATAVANYPAAAFAQSNKSSPGAQPVTGLGNSAFYVPKNATLKVLVGSTAITLQYTGYLAGAAQPSPDQVRAALISLAKGYLAQN